jgi:hypothetical protein
LFERVEKLMMKQEWIEIEAMRTMKREVEEYC